MKATPVADECIRIIEKLEELNFMFSIGKPITNDKISRYGDKKDELLKHDREAFNNLLYWGNYYSVLIHFRLLPFVRISYKGNSSFKQHKGESITEDLSDFVDKNLNVDNKNILWQVLTEYDDITTEDLKKEFWNILPDLSHLEETCQMIKMKYKNVFSNIPDKDYWDYFKLVEDYKFMAYYNSLIKYGIAQKNEVEALICKICNVVEFLNCACNSILDVYKDFLPTSANEPRDEVLSVVKYKKHPGFFNMLSAIPLPIEQSYYRMCEYSYVTVKSYGEIPIQRVAFSLINRHYLEKNKGKECKCNISEENAYSTCIINLLPPLEDYCKGFIYGYGQEFKPFIDTIKAKKESVIMSALKNHRGFITTHIGDELEFNHLYDDGLYEGERYKAWEIILQSPGEFEEFFKQDDSDKQSNEATEENKELKIVKQVTKELDPENAAIYFAKAIEKGLMTEKFEWLHGLQMLSCFASKMSDTLNIGKGLNSDGTKRISWKPFEKLFNIQSGKLRSNFNDIKKTGCLPSHVNLVDDIFN